MSAIQAELALATQQRAQDRHLVLVANGSASRVGRSRTALEAARQALSASGAATIETHLTESIAELSAAWHAFHDRRVVLLGGDGTLHAAANLPFRPPELALLPAGRANNIARALGIPLDLAEAAKLATRGTARPIDLISATNGTRSMLAVEGVSVGLHAIARASYRAPNSADIGAAVRSGLSAARRFDGVAICVASDGQGELLRVGQLFVANLPLYAFGLKVAPDARPDDGLLDIVSLPWEGRARILPTIVRLRRGTHGTRPGARMWTARRVRITTGGESPVIADTTNLGVGPVTLELAPAALAVVTP
jgi:diacylglycerol kinase family enzyme